MSDRNAAARVICTCVPAALYRQLEHEAVSISDVTRFRLLTGRVPTFPSLSPWRDQQ
jgi:hypothetical protein